jgi:bifunctional non-homologous end joining protein LigD
MLAKPGRLTTGAGWLFEPKWDGFRALIRSGADYAIRSRRGWYMTELLPEFARIGACGVFDGELIAFGRDRLPSFERIRRRMLQRDRSVPVALVLFDVLALDGEPVDRLPYLERRAILESLSFCPGVQVCPRFDDGQALWSAVRELRLEGVVAKRLSEPYPSGREVVGIKRQNPAWPRYAAEREAAVRDRQRKR